MTDTLRVTIAGSPVRTAVAGKLREAILSQRFVSGERLIERELCEMTGVSRTSVREALRQLEAEGLVELIPNHGPIVAHVSVEDAKQLYEVRGALEGLAGRNAAVRATPEQIELLKQILADIRAALPGARTEVQLQMKATFYSALFASSGNAVAERMNDNLKTRITVLRSKTMSLAGRVASTLDELDEIVSAIAARNPERAQRACEAHVATAARLAAEVLAEESENGTGPVAQGVRGRN